MFNETDISMNGWKLISIVIFEDSRIIHEQQNVFNNYNLEQSKVSNYITTFT